MVAITGAPAPAEAETTLGRGGWSYFGDPRAVHANGRTFVGWTDDDGLTRVAAVEAGEVVEQQELGPRLSRDDHNNPSLHIEPDGRITVFYSDHQGPRMYYRTSRDPYSVGSFTEARTLPTNTRGTHGFTYPNPVNVQGRMWFFFRGGDFQPNYTVRGSGWSRARTLVRGPRKARAPKLVHRPYAKYHGDGHAVHATFTEGNIGAYPNSIYYARIQGRGLYAANGRFLARLGSAPSVKRLDRVRAYSGRWQWALDVAVGNDGRPVVVYTTRRRSTRDNRPPDYWYARFDGRRWRNHRIVGYDRVRNIHRQISSITLDHEDPSTVYLSRPGSRGKLEVEVWATPDGGESWGHRAVTQDSEVDNFRPVGPRGLTGEEQVLWFAGSRTTWTAFDTNVLVKLLRRAQ